MSNQYPAADFVLMLPDEESPSDWVSVATLTNVQMERSNSDEDISTKGDDGNRRLFSAGSQRSLSVSADFIADDSTPFRTLKAAAYSTTPSIVARLDDGDDTFTATFHISSFSHQGGPIGAVSGSISLNSSGAVQKA